MSLAFGGEPTSRAMKRLGLYISGDSCLRFIRQSSPNPVITPRVLGVDDWAKCKGRTYGTILCDLERHCVIELLPDRESKTLSLWLEAHPGIEIICRDRASAYADAASISAPSAQQVADRFHLLMNLTGAVKKTVERNRKCLRLPFTDPDTPVAPPPDTQIVPNITVQPKELSPSLPPTLANNSLQSVVPVVEINTTGWSHYTNSVYGTQNC